MSLDITIKERKEFRCPDCGRLVTTQNIDAVCSGGSEWYDFLESVGYYVPYGEQADYDWYGMDKRGRQKVETYHKQKKKAAARMKKQSRKRNRGSDHG